MCSAISSCLLRAWNYWRWQWSVLTLFVILLLVYKDGVLTDWLEAGFCSNDNIAMKQWKVAADGTVEIYSLKVLGNRSVLFDDNFGSIRVQREDDTYQIDAKGKFKRLEKGEIRQS